MSKEECGAKDFDEWFNESGYDEQHRQILGIAWDASLKEADKYVEYCEGTSFGIKEELKA